MRTNAWVAGVVTVGALLLGCDKKSDVNGPPNQTGNTGDHGPNVQSGPATPPASAPSMATTNPSSPVAAPSSTPHSLSNGQSAGSSRTGAGANGNP